MAWLLGILLILSSVGGCSLVNRAPMATFTASVTAGDIPLTVEFDGSGSLDPDGRLVQWLWTFGDGTTGSGPTVTHTYTRAGKFTVRLTVSDNLGASADFQLDILAGNLPPLASFSATPSSGWIPLSVALDASASSDPNDQIVEYVWDFGDGATERGLQPVHVYQTAGTYEVTLTVRDEQGETHQARQTIRALELVQADAVKTVPSPTGFALGDFDADGMVDLAVSSSANHSLALMRGDGRGHFAAGRQFAVGDNPRTVISADFNRDGIPDLATANFDGGTVSILIGQRALGLHLIAEVEVGLWPYGLADADFNNDLYPDLVVTNAGHNSLMVLLNEGGRAFSIGPTVETGLWPSAVVVGDFDLDGAMDAAVANFFSDTVSLFPGNGDGTFGTRQDYPVGAQPVALALGDLTQDGRMDLAVTNSGQDTVSFLTNVGAGRFALETPLKVERQPWALALADLDQDGWLDLLITSTSAGGLSAWLSSGHLSFERRRGLGLGDEPVALLGQDINADGTVEWLVLDFASNQLIVMQVK